MELWLTFLHTFIMVLAAIVTIILVFLVILIRGWLNTTDVPEWSKKYDKDE